MNMNDVVIAECNEIDKKQWDEFIINHPEGNFFQSYSAYNFFNHIFDFEPFAFCALAQGSILGMLSGITIMEDGVKGYLSRRTLVWGGPLVKENNHNIAARLLSELRDKISIKSIYTEMRNLFDMSCLKSAFHSNEYEYQEHLNYLVPISGIEENKRRLSRSKRRQITKGLKAGAEIIEAKNLGQVKEFYDILSRLYKDKVKKPLTGFQFFEEFFKNKELGKLFLVKYKGEIIGGIVCPIFKDTIYQWYVCGLNKEYKHLYPGVLATWAPIEYAAKNGLKYFDFMGAGRPDEVYGVREFKAKFGGQLVNYGRFVCINKPVLYGIGKAGLKLSQLL